MDVVWEELLSGLPDARRLTHVLIRLVAATVLGAIIGAQRQRAGKPAGLRTHMMVTTGTAVFVLACSGVGMSQDALSRVIQGLTTAAGVWMTAAVGVAAGLGSLGVAIISTAFAVIILSLAKRFEPR